MIDLDTAPVFTCAGLGMLRCTRPVSFQGDRCDLCAKVNEEARMDHLRDMQDRRDERDEDGTLSDSERSPGLVE